MRALTRGEQELSSRIAQSEARGPAELRSIRFDREIRPEKLMRNFTKRFSFSLFLLPPLVHLREAAGANETEEAQGRDQNQGRSGIPAEPARHCRRAGGGGGCAVSWLRLPWACG